MATQSARWRERPANAILPIGRDIRGWAEIGETIVIITGIKPASGGGVGSRGKGVGGRLCGGGLGVRIRCGGLPKLGLGWGLG